MSIVQGPGQSLLLIFCVLIFNLNQVQNQPCSGVDATGVRIVTGTCELLSLRLEGPRLLRRSRVLDTQAPRDAMARKGGQGGTRSEAAPWAVCGVRRGAEVTGAPLFQGPSERPGGPPARSPCPHRCHVQRGSLPSGCSDRKLRPVLLDGDFGCRNGGGRRWIEPGDIGSPRQECSPNSLGLWMPGPRSPAWGCTFSCLHPDGWQPEPSCALGPRDAGRTEPRRGTE